MSPVTFFSMVRGKDEMLLQGARLGPMPLSQASKITFAGRLSIMRPRVRLDRHTRKQKEGIQGQSGSFWDF